jgi:hypothetical protein
MQPMSETEARRRRHDVANAAALLRDAARRADGGPTVVHTPHGKAEIHADEHGADVKLPTGATVHVRFNG